ncbi:hypothetical protein KC323_g60 [Hortaea werneckii]|nr:hypothetical protein KC323_g60 [Hortaea werneckii]
MTPLRQFPECSGEIIKKAERIDVPGRVASSSGTTRFMVVLRTGGLSSKTATAKRSFSMTSSFFGENTLPPR